MSRLIDADKLKRKCQKEATEAWKMNLTAKIESTMNQFIDFIDEMPTVDAVEVVRCKDCQWHECEEPGMVWCPNIVGSWVDQDFFCGYGEPRGDGISDNLIDRQGAIEHAIAFWKDNDGDSAMQMIIDYLRTVPSPPEATKERGSEQKDCRDCVHWNDCPLGKTGHDKGTSFGYSIGECKEFSRGEKRVND